MTEDEVVETIRAFIEKQFPKTCNNCERTFQTLGDYLCTTRHVGDPVSFDVDLEDWQPAEPIGTFSFSNCECGTALVISSRGMGAIKMLHLMRWAKQETRNRGVTLSDLLSHIRARIDESVLASRIGN